MKSNVRGKSQYDFHLAPQNECPRGTVVKDVYISLRDLNPILQNSMVLPFNNHTNRNCLGIGRMGKDRPTARRGIEVARKSIRVHNSAM